MNRAVFFDLDGTLLDSLADLRNAVNLTRASYGAGPLGLADVRRFVGDGIRLLVERALAGIPHDPDEAVRRQFTNYGAHCLDDSTLYPGVAEGLKTLHDLGWSIGLVTNKPEDLSDRILRHFGVRAYFDRIAGGGGAYPLKPDPAGCLAMLAELGVEPKHGVMVGDHCTDLEVGRRAGMTRVLAQWGFGEPREEKWDRAVPDFPALTAWLAEQQGGIR